MNPAGKVVVYRLNTRYLQQDGQPPEVSKQIVYYSLAVGHHVGVIDTFKAALTWPYDAYLDWVATLPEGEARRKLDGVRRFGEIQVDSSHTRLLREALAADSPIARELDAQLEAIEGEPALYLMVRRVS
jgi:hydrogenase-4 component J